MATTATTPTLQAATTGSAALREVRERLAARAYLFDDPTAYLAGVDDVLVALAATGSATPAGAAVLSA
ncbi:MAG: hypothetical protein ACLGIR_06945 [Actinomycetes bacterium]